MIGKIKENVTNVQKMMSEMNFPKLIQTIEDTLIKKKLYFQIIKVGDWNSIVSFDILARPNITSKTAPWCPTCRML